MGEDTCPRRQSEGSHSAKRRARAGPSSGRPHALAVHTCGVESQLGLFRAAIIVWVSGVVASALLGILVSPVAWALVAGSARHIDQRWGLTAILVLVNALIAGAGVTFGVGIFGFRLG